MKALVLRGAREFFYEERPYPDCPPDQVVVRVDACASAGLTSMRSTEISRCFPFPE